MRGRMRGVGQILESLKNEVAGIQTVMVDLADWTATRHALENVGKIELLMNNAATAIMSPFQETTKEDLDKVLDVNFKAVFNLSQIVARSMVERGNGGAVVNVSSIGSRRAMRNIGSYCSSNGALDSLIQVMATELGPHKLRVNSVNPHLVPSTDMGNALFVLIPHRVLENSLSRIPLNRFPGIGRGIIKKLAECGAECVALSKTQEYLDSLKNEVPGIQTVLVDLADWTATRHALKNIGKIDLLVNNAAILIMSPFLETAKDDLDKTLDVNFKAVFNVSQIVARSMVERGNGGAIVNVSSVASRTAVRNMASYCSSKGAMDSLTQVMANELGPHKIRVNSVHPHIVQSTDMGGWASSTPEIGDYYLSRIPLNRFPDVDDVVNAVVFLLSDKASNLNGIALPIEGGFEAN